MSKKIVIFGAGGFGTALSLVLTRAGHLVELFDKDEEAVDHWSSQGYSDLYEWLRKYKFPSELILRSYSSMGNRLLKTDGYHFIIIATSRLGVNSVLPYIDFTECPGLVFLQKSIDSDLMGAAESFIKNRDLDGDFPIMQFTGAGFAKDIAYGDDVQMVIGYEVGYKDTAEKFADLFLETRIWPVFYHDMRSVNLYGSLRTIASFEQGAAYGCLCKGREELPESTLANVYAGTIQELRAIALQLGVTPEVLNPGSPIGEVMEADLILCRSMSSRNFALGRYVGEGLSLKEAEIKIDGVAEGVYNINEVYGRLSKGPTDLDRFPYLYTAHLMLTGAMSPKGCAEMIFTRRNRRFRL